MTSAFSTTWKASKQPSKQRKYVYQAPMHLMHRMLAAHLSETLRKKHGKRSVPVVKGDKVKVLRGQYKGRENKVERVDAKRTQIYITGVERAKKDGSKSFIPIKPSNVMITELNLNDKKRRASIEGKKTTAKPAATKTSEAKPAEAVKPVAAAKPTEQN